MRPIRVFLGGYINSTNAQNLNCLALARHLDRKRFRVGALHLYSGDLPLDGELVKKIRLFRTFRPHRFSRYLAYWRGIFWADVVYLPKGEICGWNLFWIRLLGKKSFRTVEGIYGEEMLAQLLRGQKSHEAFLRSLRRYDRLYSITRFLAEYNRTRHGIVTEEKILYLGTETSLFANPDKEYKGLREIVFVGRLKKRKGVYDILALARRFPGLTFHLVGDGEERESLEKTVATEGLKNVRLHGVLSHARLAELLKRMDLHLFPSRSEGFPKVTLETAAAGVPSLVYSDYGADEWIDHGTDGFVVDTLEEMESILRTLLDDPERLRSLSRNAMRMAERFDWKNLIKDWEQVIEELH